MCRAQQLQHECKRTADEALLWATVTEQHLQGVMTEHQQLRGAEG